MAARPTWKGVLKISCTWNRGLLIADREEARFVQVNIGRGSTQRRVLWWPRLLRTIGLRVWGEWWLNLHWRLLDTRPQKLPVWWKARRVKRLLRR